MSRTKGERELTRIVADLRVAAAYEHLVAAAGEVPRGLASGLLGPQIERLQKLLNDEDPRLS